MNWSYRGALAAFGLGCFGLLACSSSASGTGGTDAGASNGKSPDSGKKPPSGGGDSGTLVGTFQVKVTPASAQIAASTAVIGKVYDGPTPSTIIWENPQVDGECTLTTPRVPFCDTPCGGSSACVEDGKCQAYPTAHEVGSVTVTGVHTKSGESTFMMTAVANAYQPPAGVTLAFPPFSDGEKVTLVAAGGALPGFTLSTNGVAPLELTSTSITLKSGDGMNLVWTPGAAGNSKINVKLDISHHGGSKGQILCQTNDSGSLTVSAALVKKLLGLGVAGYPSVIVTRHSVGSSVISAGRVDLDVSSTVEQSVGIEGLISCTDDSECSSGKTCQSDLSCR